MTNAESTSTDSTTEPVEKAKNQPSLVAISEENLAALLRATSGSAEADVPHPAEPEYDKEPAPVTEANDSSAAAPANPPAAGPEAAENPLAESVESRLALFAAVKERRSALLQSEVTPVAPPLDLPRAETVDTTPGPAAQPENPAASLPPDVAPLQVTLPQSQPLIPAPSASIVTSLSTAHSRDRDTRRTRLVVGLVVGALIAAVGVTTLLTRAHPAKTPAVAPVAPKDNSPLQVQAEPLGNGLINVRWNSQSALIAQARDGRLVITEHEKQPRILALEVEQLKIGHLTYQSSAENIEFDLEVVDRSGAITKESVLALSSAISSGQRAGTPPQTPREQTATLKPQNVAQPSQPQVQTSAPSALTNGSLNQPVANQQTPTRQNIPNNGASIEAPQASQSKVRTFVPPAAPRNREQRPIIDAPPALTNGPVTPLGVALPASLTPISPPPARVGAASQQIRVETNLQAAKLLNKVIPIYPALAKSAGIQGIVRFTALIGKDGRIQNLTLTGGPSPLVDSATAAVKQWVYRPTILNGEPVEVITQINVNFTLSGDTR